MWSDLPSGGRDREVYASFTLAYSRTSVFSSLVVQVTYRVNFRIILLMETLLKSHEIIMRALGCAVCSPAIVELMTSHADVGLADGEYTQPLQYHVRIHGVNNTDGGPQLTLQYPGCRCCL